MTKAYSFGADRAINGIKETLPTFTWSCDAKRYINHAKVPYLLSLIQQPWLHSLWSRISKPLITAKQWMAQHYHNRI